MVRLNLQRINRLSPYEVTQGDNPMCYQFITDYGGIYAISFIEDDLLLCDDSYQFIIANINNKKSPQDYKLREAIMAIVYEFFECSNTTLLYICETGDGKQSMRSRLFELWFNTSPRKSDFVFMSADVKDADGIRNYAAIILRVDNPNLKNVVAEFTENIQLLSQKP